MNSQKVCWSFISALAAVCGIECFSMANSAIAAPLKDVSAQAEPVELAQATTVCRRVLPTPTLVRTNGVLLRSEASRSSRIAGIGYAPGQKFDTARKTVKSSDGLIWLEVTAPRAGWIWAGSGNKITNIGNCL
ncbi:hypothetical protein JOY44_16630 [Phormidium sp. CLA17]|uniref:hypothetical protein n=1 Tax=Leptolyngbya sp. Cla-17 TaxID=2803751 RepID=UPI001492B7F5|nr:hypothetical protein [Leptolyngbya sp. Cla-17]MBM0743216.1 hypothetical protein [Leptolyngbya sp. Cla-17]